MSFFEGGIEETLKAARKELKEWESAFEQKNGRKPSKKDITSNNNIGLDQNDFVI
jgi:hypothetical protein